MPAYRYRALDPDGVRFASTIDAGSLDEAVQVLGRKGLAVQSIELDDGLDPDDLIGTATARSNGSSPRLEPVAGRPPAAPRNVDPKSITAPGGSVLLLVGAIFTIVGFVFVVTGIGLLLSGNRAGWAIGGFPLIHLSVGLGLLYYSLSRRARRIQLAETGSAAVATIKSIGYDTKVRVNGRNPFKIEFEFDVDGIEYSGKRSTMNSEITKHQLHDRIWVLYDSVDPNKNMEWPPL